MEPALEDREVSGTEAVAVRVRGLTIVYRTEVGERPAVRDVDLDLPAGRITGIVGESGSGKSTLALSLLNAVPKPGRIADGRVEVGDLGDVTEQAGRGLGSCATARWATSSRPPRTRSTR